MIKTILFATPNDRKIKEAKAACDKYEIKIEQIKLDIAEIQSDNPEEIGRDKIDKAIAQTKKPVIMSCGMGNHGEIQDALNVLSSNEVTLLYCVCSYPTNKRDLNFTEMFKLWLRFRKPVGFSSHCPEIYPAIKAAGLGASVIEHHFTMSRKLPGCDQSSSLEPNEFRKMCDIIRELDKVP